MSARVLGSRLIFSNYVLFHNDLQGSVRRDHVFLSCLIKSRTAIPAPVDGDTSFDLADHEGKEAMVEVQGM